MTSKAPAHLWPVAKASKTTLHHTPFMPDSPLPDAPVSTDAVRWFYSQNGAVIGPMPLASLRALWNAKELPSDTLAVLEGSEDWQQLADVLGSLSAVSPPALPLPVTTPADVRASTRALPPVWMLVLGGFAVLMIVVGVIGSITKRQSNASSSERGPVPGLTADKGKLRTIKDKAYLFEDASARTELQTVVKADDRASALKMWFDGRYISPGRLPVGRSLKTADRTAEVTDEITDGLRKVIVHDLHKGESFYWWTDEANLMPFDEAEIRRMNNEFNSAHRDEINRQAKRRELVGMLAQPKEGSMAYADDEVYWEVERASPPKGEKQAEGSPYIQFLSSLIAEQRIIHTGKGSSGIVVSVDSPSGSMFKMQTNINGKPVSLWCFDDDAEFKPDPAQARAEMDLQIRAKLKSAFGDRLRNIEIGEITDSSAPSLFNVQVRFNASSNLKTSWIRSGIEDDMKKAYSLIYTSFSNVHEVWLFAYLPMTDQYGNTSDDIVYKTSLAEVEAAKINWSNTAIVNFPAIWKTLFIAPALRVSE